MIRYTDGHPSGVLSENRKTPFALDIGFEIAELLRTYLRLRRFAGVACLGRYIDPESIWGS